MTDWNCQVCKIEKIVKHPNADSLSIATVMSDYPVVIKTGQYQVEDLVGYLAVDTIVPDTEEFYFLCPKAYEKYEDEQGQLQQRQLGPKYPIGQVPEKYRVLKAKRIRGTYSIGMLVNFSWLNDPMDTGPGGMGEMMGLSHKVPREVGDSIVEWLGLKKYEEPEEEDNIVSFKMRGANAESPPKGWSIPHYDIDGIRKYLSCLQDGEEIVLTEKLNGSNASYCHDGEKLWSKSRNWYKKQDSDDPWWDIALRYNLEEKLVKYPLIVLFGELVGNVKGFRYTTEISGGKLHTKIFFFDAFDTKHNRYLDYDDFLSIIQDLGLEATPELYRGPWLGKETMYPYAEGTSILNSKHIREGFVLRTVNERYEPRLDSRMQVKLIGEGYSLQK